MTVVNSPKLPGRKIVVGVMGSASGPMSQAAMRKAFLLGQAIARAGCVTLTGACPGLPFESVRGAKAEGGLTLGISPAESEREHVSRYTSPRYYHDVIIFTGSGFMGREVTNIQSCDMVVICGGRSGTLGEFAIAYDQGKIIGILEGTGGIVDEIRTIIRVIHKPTGSKIIFDTDPERLVKRLLKLHEQYNNAEKPFIPG
ncbi:MAG: hypothetical protein WC712_06375 [Candidatus Brocadiia bacterium]